MIELTKGQELDLASDDGTLLSTVTVGLGWDHSPTAGFIGSGAPEIDLDASAVQFAGTQLFDLAFYNNLTTRDGSVTHLGDNTSGRGDGDDETISVDLSKVYSGVDSVVLLVSSYHGHSLEFVSNAYCRILDVTGTEVARLTITLGVRDTGLAMAKIYRDGDRWRLHALGEGIAVTKPATAPPALQRFL